MSEEVPERFGKCKVVRLLGEGATAMVYLAKHEGLDISVAVKVLRKKLSEKRPEYADRFLREARTAASLEHPNIVRVIDCGIEQGYHYMVMDYVDGPNCLEKLQHDRQGLSWREATTIVQQATAGLAHAAGRGVIHRDVKPSNIMIDSTGRARVTDLGLAKLTIKGMVSLTQELTTVGTPNYMSPEQIRSSQDLDLRTDIYSLGATFYHLVCGRPPFFGKTAMEVVAQHLSTPLEPPSKARPDLPAALSSIICKMMAKSPGERYQNYDELCHDMQNLLEGKVTTAEGFEETQPGIEDEELRRLLDELSLGTGLKVEQEEERAEAPEEVAAAAEKAKGSTTTLDPFGPNDFRAYTPLTVESGDSTVLAETLRKQQEKKGHLSVVVTVIGVIALIALIILIISLIV